MADYLPDPPPTVQMVTVPVTEWEELKREELLRTLEARVSQRVNRRFWAAFTLVSLVSLFATQAIAYLIISERLYPIIGSAQQAAADARAQAAFLAGAARSRDGTRDVASAAPLPSATSDPALRQAQAALKRAEEQAAKSNGQLESLGRSIERLNAKIASLESANASVRSENEKMRTQLARGATKDEEKATAPQARSAAPPPPAPPPQELARLPEEKVVPFIARNAEYEVRLVTVGKTEAKMMPALEDHFKQMGYRVVADAAPDQTSAYPTRQDLVFITYKRGKKREAEKIERVLKLDFNLHTILARYDVGDRLAGDIQIAFQESK